MEYSFKALDNNTKLIYNQAIIYKHVMTVEELEQFTNNTFKS